MENNHVGRCSQSLDEKIQRSGAEKYLQASERPGHEKDGSDARPQPESLRLTTWNKPRINIWRASTTFLAFFIMGLHDGAYGVSYVPHHACQLNVADAARP